MSRLLCASALLLAACLSSPKPSSVADDSGPDRDGAEADGPDGAGSPFPGAHSINIRDAIAQDVDGDQIVDLYIVNQSETAADRGVFILKGPQKDPEDLRYHTFINTVADPHHILFVDVVGDPELDLLLIGKRDALADSVIEIYRQNSDGTFDSPTFNQVNGFQPDSNFPVTIAHGAFTGGLANDIVVSDINSAFVYLIDDSITDVSQGLSSTTPTQLFRDGTGGALPFDNGINGILARSLGGATDDLFIIESRTSTWLRNDGSGNFVADPSVADGSFPVFAIEEIDVDGMLPLDIVGGGLFDFGVWFVEPGGTAVTLEHALFDYALDTELTDVSAGDLEGSSNPEVVVFDNPLVGDGEVLIFLDVSRNGAMMNPSTPIVSALEFTPNRGLVFDFDNQGRDEIWALEQTTGRAACVEFVSAAPAACVP